MDNLILKYCSICAILSLLFCSVGASYEQQTHEKALDPTSIERDPKDVAHRIIALLIVGGKGYGLSQDKVSLLIQQYASKNYFSDDEWLFLEDTSFIPEQHIVPRYYEYKWRIESACILLWAAGFIETDMVAQPNVVCDDATLLAQIKPVEQLIEEITFRDASEIWKMYSRYQQYEKLTRDARILERDPDDNIAAYHPAIVNWRFIGLKWLIESDEWLQ